jgi:hypothetical protein
MRGISIILAAMASMALSQGAHAQDGEYSGRWLFSGLITSTRSATSFAQICDLSQTGTQNAGPCHGPNGGCSLVGVLNSNQVDFTCRIAVPNHPSLDGVITFHGNLAPDGLLRGSCSHSRAPGVPGQASLMRI